MLYRAIGKTDRESQRGERKIEHNFSLGRGNKDRRIQGAGVGERQRVPKGDPHATNERGSDLHDGSCPPSANPLQAARGTTHYSQTGGQEVSTMC